jgi:hypothetical protein
MEERITARDNRELRTAIIVYSTLVLVSLGIGLYGFVSLISLATRTLNQGRLFG